MKNTRKLLSITNLKKYFPVAKSSLFQKDANAGTQGMLMDDEWSNQIFDKVDYHPETKKLFKKYLEDKGEKYLDPLVIVKNKKT